MPGGRLPIEGRGFGLMGPAAADPAEEGAREKCVFAKRTQLENGILTMRDWLELHFGVFTNEPKMCILGREKRGGEIKKERKRVELLTDEATSDTGLESPVDPQTGKSALRGRGLGGACVAFEFVSAAADPATAGLSRAPGKWEQGGKNPGRGGKGFSILLRKSGGGGKWAKKFPPEVGKESATLLGKWKGGGNFPLFPGGDPLRVRNSECGARNWGGIAEGSGGESGKHPTTNPETRPSGRAFEHATSKCGVRNWGRNQRGR